MTNLTPKEIAQTYVINDIVIHELILKALNEVELELLQSSSVATKYDIIHRAASIATRDILCTVFEITANDLLRTLKEDYQSELEDLAKKSQDLS